MKHAIIALALFSGVAMADCREASDNAIELLRDVQGETIEGAIEEGPDSIHGKALDRRLRAAEQALISVKVYCHDQPSKIKATNKMQDFIDKMRADIGL